MHTPENRRPSCHLSGTCQNTALYIWWLLNPLGVPFVMTRRMLPTSLQFSIDDFFFPFFFFLNFHTCPFKNSNQPFNLLFLQIWYLFLLFLFVLFRIIYKIQIFFISSPINFFHLSNLVFILFIVIYFIWDSFLNWFFNTISSSLSFFLSNSISIHIAIFFSLWQFVFLDFILQY